MASIYRATDERLQRIVCVKLLRLVLEAGSTSGSSVYQATYAHFLQEALALSRLHHPNTLKIFDFGYLEETTPGANVAGAGRPFQISEFLDAGNLEQLVRREGPVLPSALLSILDPIGGAMAEAHEQNIIHRDIKPSNILFARINQSLIPKLADFGIAHSNPIRKKTINHTDDDDVDPVSVVTLFSPRWAAPEQLAGASSGPPTDVYSLALVTVFMLAGRAMFEGKEVRATFPERVIGDRLVTRRLGEMGIAPPLQPPLLRALAARVVERTASVTAFVNEMRDAISSMNAFPDREHRRRMPSEVTDTLSTPLATRQHGTAQLEEPPPVPPQEIPISGGARATIVEVDDRLDLAVPTTLGVDARVRLTFVPARDGYRVNVKGLNCFVVRDGRPAAAILVDRDAILELLSSGREPMGRLAFTFGAVSGANRVFPAIGPELVLPLYRAQRAVAVHIASTGELIVMCSQA